MKIVIVGAGAVGTHLSKLLSREHQDCVLIDDNEERLEGVAEYDVMTYNALPTSINALKEAGADKADLFVGVTTEESTNTSSSWASTPWSIPRCWRPSTSPTA